MPDLLIELLSEEIPARMQAKAAGDLQRLMTDGMVEAGLTYASARAFVTPRRLALAVEGLSPHSPTLREIRRGPRVGAPDKAVEGFLRSTGLTREQLGVEADRKGEVYVAEVVTPGRAAAGIVAEVLEATVRGFPWPKSMRWGAGALRWVRPLQGVLCILSDEAGAEVVPLEIDGLVASDRTRGHRFMAPEPFSVTGFEDYEAKLKRARVVLDAEARAGTIRHDAESQAFARGLELVEDRGLLAEVAGLVEWPVVLTGAIDETFLGLPPEVLRTSMKEHQKFFSLRNPGSGRIEGFATVANIETADHGATILAGNRKVLAARLSDARFFWENDLRTIRDGGMAAMAAPLAQVTFHNRLGSQGQRIARIAALARDLAPAVGADPDRAEEAARIAKADLASEMVYEFPELQGVMGRYYAEAAGHAPEVAAACASHYKPMGPSDEVPSEPVAVAVALADKLDLLTGFWWIDEKPTGSGDPFALRRAALGIIRIVLANGLRLPLDRYIDAQLVRFELGWQEAQEQAEEQALLTDLLTEIARHGVFGAAVHTVMERLEGDLPEVLEAVRARVPDTSVDLMAFFHDRLKVHLRDEGLRHDVIDACLAMPGSDDLALLVRRAEALGAVLKTEDGENLVQGFRRANNILAQAEEADGRRHDEAPDRALAETAEEQALFDALERAGAAISPAIEAEDFASAMGTMASLRAPIDAFFEAVQVNTEEPKLRRNRLRLLNRIRETCLSAADLTRLGG